MVVRMHVRARMREHELHEMEGMGAGWEDREGGREGAREGVGMGLAPGHEFEVGPDPPNFGDGCIDDY
jgi:hypothetical protein